MRAFIGPHWGAYRRLWARMKGSPRWKISRSYRATIFSSLWLLGRKQYLLGGALLALQVAALKIKPELSSILDIFAAGFVGTYGKAIVIASGVKTIKRVRASGVAPDVAAIRIASAGGRDWVTPICGGALFLGMLVATLSGFFGHVGPMMGPDLGALLGGASPTSSEGDQEGEAKLLELMQSLQKR